MLFVGLSVPLCIRDIMRGKMRLEDVQIIVANCKSENWAEAVDCWKKHYWQDNPEKGGSILRSLLSAGKIIKPGDDEKVQIAETGWWRDPKGNPYKPK